MWLKPLSLYLGSWKPKTLPLPTPSLWVEILCISDKCYPSVSDSLTPTHHAICFARDIQQLRSHFQILPRQRRESDLVKTSESLKQSQERSRDGENRGSAPDCVPNPPVFAKPQSRSSQEGTGSCGVPGCIPGRQGQECRGRQHTSQVTTQELCAAEVQGCSLGEGLPEGGMPPAEGDSWRRPAPIPQDQR